MTEDPKVLAFLQDIKAVCDKHGLGLSGVAEVDVVDAGDSDNPLEFYDNRWSTRPPQSPESIAKRGLLRKELALGLKALISVDYSSFNKDFDAIFTKS